MRYAYLSYRKLPEGKTYCLVVGPETTNLESINFCLVLLPKATSSTFESDFTGPLCGIISRRLNPGPEGIISGSLCGFTLDPECHQASRYLLLYGTEIGLAQFEHISVF